MWLTCTVLTMRVPPHSPGLDDSSPLLWTTAWQPPWPACLVLQMALGPAMLHGDKLQQPAVAKLVQQPGDKLDLSTVIKLGFPKQQHRPSSVPPPQAQARPRGELISVGKEPRAAVTQSPAAEITGAIHSHTRNCNHCRDSSNIPPAP